MKRNEDQSVAECCGESKKNVERKNEYKEMSLINNPEKIDLRCKSLCSQMLTTILSPIEELGLVLRQW